MKEMANLKNVLLLGAGGNVTNGIYRILKDNKYRGNRVFVSCVKHVPVKQEDFFLLSPYANDKSFCLWLSGIINMYSIDIVVSGVEEIINEVAKNRDFFKSQNVDFAFESNEKIQIFQSKLATSKWLRDNKIRYPKFFSSEDNSRFDVEFFFGIDRLILKPNSGKSSQGIRIFDYSDFDKVCVPEGYIVQEYIGDESEEITVGCLLHNNKVYQCQLRRELLNGHTMKVELICNSLVTEYCEKIVRLINPKYPINIQLRIDKDGLPVCFEINLRVSGSAPFRHLLNFRDVEAMFYVNDSASLDDYFVDMFPVGTIGQRFYREEVDFKGQLIGFS